MGWCKWAAIVGTAAILVAVPALAGPPNNDDRADAQGGVGARHGRRHHARVDARGNDPGGGCSSVEGTSGTASTRATTGRVAIEMTARGDLEGVIEVFERDRSELRPVDCDPTNRRGDASVSFVAETEKRYLIRVGEEFDSESGDFRLELFQPGAGSQASWAAPAAPRRRRDRRSRT